MIVWLNGTHGAGTTTTASLVQQLIPGSRVSDAEKVGETLMDVRPGFASYDIPVHHFVLHSDQHTLRERIQNDAVPGPSTFRFEYLAPYDEAFRGWLRDEAHVVDTTDITPAQATVEISAML